MCALIKRIESKSLFSLRLVFILPLVLPSCIKIAASTEENDPFPRHVILMGFDGWSSTSFEASNMPYLKSIINGSASSFKKRSVLPTSSACNWASMFKGAGPEAHGYNEWNSRKPSFPPTAVNEKGEFPNIFSVLKENYPYAETGYFYQWEGMKYLFDLRNVNLVKQFPTSTLGSDEMSETAIEYIRKAKPALLAIIWDYPDVIGHSSGWDSLQFQEELSHLDSFIEETVKVCKEIGIYDQTLIIITSDHGGHSKTHGTINPSDLETPLILVGGNIRKGVINTPILQYDVASIIADFLFLKHPNSWRGKSPDGIFM